MFSIPNVTTTLPKFKTRIYHQLTYSSIPDANITIMSTRKQVNILPVPFHLRGTSNSGEGTGWFLNYPNKYIKINWLSQNKRYQ